MSTFSDAITQSAAIRAAARRPLENDYGHFDFDTREFVIEDVLTPRPWVNVLSNGRYGLVVSQLGGGFSWFGNSQLCRITRWEQDLPLDAYGRWIYVFDPEREELNATTFAPVRLPAIEEEVRHGLGYSTFIRRFARYETRETLFVPQGVDAEHHLIEIRNLTEAPLALRLGSFLVWHLGEQGEWHREFHRLFVALSAAGDTIVAAKRAGLREGSREALPAIPPAYVQLAGLDEVEWFSDQGQWLGRAGRLDWPEGLIGSEAPRVTGRWDDPIAAFRSELVLQPGEIRRFALTLGVGPAPEGATRPAVAEIGSRLERTKSFFRDRSGILNVRTTDQALDLMVNGWLPYQAEVGRMQARCAYYQQGGAYGFRDQLQDGLMLLDSDPAATLDQLGRHAEAMYEDGGVRHWWHPESRTFAESNHSDTCLWLAYSVLDYLDETGDLSILKRPHRFLTRTTQQFGSEGTLLEHCQRGINRFLERRSKRGLPLIGAGDWNDGLSHAGIEGKGESVWLAMFGFQILGRLGVIYDRLGEDAMSHRARDEAERLQQAVEKYGWDGEWYIAGTRDDGRPFGASENAEGQIFLNPQTWAAISQIGSAERIDKALESVRKRLLRPYGALLLAPAYREMDPTIGYITRYAPGLRENGGVYSHASVWAVQALFMAGDAAAALKLYQSMLPPIRAAAAAEKYQAEPYVMPGNVDGPDSPFEGRAGWTWYTGSAAWMRRTAIRCLLGVRATFDGLVVRPSLSFELGPYRLSRPFRGDQFEIEVEMGTRHRLIVDGQEYEGPAIPASGRCFERTVRLEAID